ncbi:hypothetical protein A1OE_1155 [Candidatus Endolissoclinum faulkneri L2]|uniref:Uncharacterized protein n=1 Tax=Candidatus Endolissoclinum faulkneri L2 TaxID=1193729 RepID=K7Z5K3_9PROT|nr:hypothetical protein A1OE_1155 [Candidatus Endolissoclinum faulkneri L2]
MALVKLITKVLHLIAQYCNSMRMGLILDHYEFLNKSINI